MAHSNLGENSIEDIPESYQRYLDEIYDIAKTKKGGWVSNKELAEHLNVKPASVSGMLEKLKEKDLIKWEPRKSIRLTDIGKKIAIQLGQTHKLLKIFFEKVLKIKDNELTERLSCEIEHHITQEVQKSLKLFLDNYLE
ncbi:MAG: metal-dependent transcriptional regulator [Candidatus Hermodarchaeota archaeon]